MVNTRQIVILIKFIEECVHSQARADARMFSAGSTIRATTTTIQIPAWRSGGTGSGRTQWFEAVRADIAPALFAARTLRRELSEALREYELEQMQRPDSSSSGDSTVEHLAGLEVANLLPPPPPVVVRRFAADAPEIVKWLRGYAMGVALVRHNAGAASTACGMLFDASRVRLVRVATSFEDVL